MGSGIPHPPFPAKSIKASECVQSGPVAPSSPFFAEEDDGPEDQLDFDDDGMSSAPPASSEGGSGMHPDNRFPGALCQGLGSKP